jgi:hypothetical protein
MAFADQNRLPQGMSIALEVNSGKKRVEDRESPWNLKIKLAALFSR